ncbi:MAG: type III-B CRISPR module-associated protein Cmr5 [Crenarchaeota archaeon]|nr:type III-B CRISPR module-associated protein Cmr5 [Thermoproteota archaeon]
MSEKGIQKTVTEDIIALRVSKLVNNIVNILRDIEKKEVKSEKKEDKTLQALRTRARQLYEALVYHGLYQVVAYCAGKALYQNLLRVYNALSNKDLNKLKSDLDSILQGIEDAEDRAYALYGGILLRELVDLGCLDNVPENMSDLLENLMENNYAEQVAYIVAKWIKLCAEALIRKE